jgi:hypothetical protein
MDDFFAIDLEELGTHCEACGHEAQDGDEFVLYDGLFICSSCYKEKRELEVELFVRIILDAHGFGDLEITKVEKREDSVNE